MEILFGFPGGARVEAHFNGCTVKTDQPPPIGNACAPTPFDLFLASIGACAGAMALSLCRQLEIPAGGVQISERVEVDAETGLARQISLDIQLPPDFPLKYKRALVRVAEQCLVKKQLEQPPTIGIRASEQVPA
jgi:ribosomal protein S12 methylthiotransferase accessory factor